MTTIIYIGTERYMELFEQFYNAACKIDGEKEVIVLTNKNCEVKSRNECPIIKIQHIDHLPWPLPTLLKFHYIDSILDWCGDRVLYANANFLLKEGLELENDDKLHLSYMDTEKYPECKSWPSINEFNPELRHVLGGFFYARKDVMQRVCKDIMWNINGEMQHGIIAPIHDETALNRHYQRFTDNCSVREIHNYGELTSTLYSSGQRFKPFIPGEIKY